ncbi:MAG: HAD-IC family P-type ATPase, partial [Oscillospiraceae bacterium]
RDSIAELMDIRPDFANVEQDGVLVQIAPEEVEIGSIITVKVGEKVPIDGIVTEGTSSLDTAALTGESVPREASIGDEIISGCVNLTAVLKIKTTKNFGSSTVSKILDLVENASNKKAVAENFISKFARIYTPCVVFAAMALAFIPPLVFGGNFSEWLNRGLIFLVISCPCALVISVPLSFFGGIGGASKQGILIKGSSYMETLANATTVVFDKTGTLTKGVFEVCEISPVGISEGELLKKAAMAEFYSNHPISLSLKKAFTETIDKSAIGKSEEIAGFGVKTEVNGEEIHVGNKKLMGKLGITCDNANTAGTILYIACNGAYCGHIVIADTIKDNCS